MMLLNKIESITEVSPPTLNEIVELGAVDSEFFSHYFFPNTVRQASPAFHREIDELIDGPGRYINIQVFRGGAKTSKLRITTAKRIAYGLAHTILYIGKSEGHAARSIQWLRRQVEYNAQYANTFGLRKGDKWSDIEAEIWHGTDEYPIWIMGMGITGAVRGVNRDDFRPDLIVVDDVIDDENSATADQREKIENLIYGAIKESLAPASEAPHAKLAMLQTPLNKQDASTKALDDPEWDSAVFGCWTEETKDLPVQQQISRWEIRYPSDVLRKEKQAAAARNRLSVFIREKECRLVSPETSSFKPKWVNFYELTPENMHVVLVIDPVPPPSDIQLAKGMHKKDFEALTVMGRYKKNMYLLEYVLHRGHEPNWTVAEFFRLAAKWRPIRVYVEATGYQRTLAWLLKQAMEHERRWWAIETFDDHRGKYTKITDGLTGLASAGHLWCKREHTDFIEQFNDYPDIAHDDLIETVALGATYLSRIGFGGEGDDSALDEDDIPALEHVRGAP